MRKRRILFVCLGNICRSPTMQGAFRDALQRAGLLDRFELDSAGIGNWHRGEGADARSLSACLRQGIDIRSHRARQIEKEDFRTFDTIFACDREILRELRRRAPADASARIELLLPFAGLPQEEIPDPYYGGPEGFDEMVSLCRQVAQALVAMFSPEVAKG